jgi:hypothetical protein
MRAAARANATGLTPAAVRSTDGGRNEPDATRADAPPCGQAVRGMPLRPRWWGRWWRDGRLRLWTGTADTSGGRGTAASSGAGGAAVLGRAPVSGAGTLWTRSACVTSAAPAVLDGWTAGRLTGGAAGVTPAVPTGDPAHVVLVALAGDAAADGAAGDAPVTPADAEPLAAEPLQDGAPTAVAALGPVVDEGGAMVAGEGVVDVGIVAGAPVDGVVAAVGGLVVVDGLAGAVVPAGTDGAAVVPVVPVGEPAAGVVGEVEAGWATLVARVAPPVAADAAEHRSVTAAATTVRTTTSRCGLTAVTSLRAPERMR